MVTNEINTEFAIHCIAGFAIVVGSVGFRNHCGGIIMACGCDEGTTKTRRER